MLRWLKEGVHMPLHQVDVYVLDDFINSILLDRLHKVAEASLMFESPESPLAMELSIVDDETVRELNKQYRGVDENTDVLAFSSFNQGHYYGDNNSVRGKDEDIQFVTPPGYKTNIGEIIISFDQAKRQSDPLDHKIEEEIDFLIVHGVLHLFGYDHITPEDEVKMKIRTNKIFLELKVK